MILGMATYVVEHKVSALNTLNALEVGSTRMLDHVCRWSDDSTLGQVVEKKLCSCPTWLFGLDSRPPRFYSVISFVGEQQPSFSQDL